MSVHFWQETTQECQCCGMAPNEQAFQREQHMTFDCMFHSGVTQDAWKHYIHHFPDEHMQYTDWCALLRQLRRNPIVRDTGPSVLVRFFYFEALVARLNGTADLAKIVFPKGSAEDVTRAPDWRQLLKAYKNQTKAVTLNRSNSQSCLAAVRQ